MNDAESSNGVSSAVVGGLGTDPSGNRADPQDHLRNLELECARLHAELKAVAFERDAYRDCVYGHASEELHMSKEEAEAYFTELLRHPEDLVSLDPVIEELEQSLAASETAR